MPQWASWKDVPVGEQNWISSQVDLWEQTIGYQVPISSQDMLSMAVNGVETAHDIGNWAANGVRVGDNRFATVLNNMPWAGFGLDKDTYVQMSETFGTEYKKITGQDISKEALAQAFQNPRDQSGGLLTASQYAQQLMNDTNIQNTYGWVKYGLDFNQWTQQKLSMRSAFGRDVTDPEAATVLQYHQAAQGAQMNVIGRAAQAPPTTPQAGVAQSVVR